MRQLQAVPEYPRPLILAPYADIDPLVHVDNLRPTPRIYDWETEAMTTTAELFVRAFTAQESERLREFFNNLDDACAPLASSFLPDPESDES